MCDFRDANRGVKFGIRPFKVEQFKGKINKLEVKKTQKGDFQRVKIIKKHAIKRAHTAKGEENYIRGFIYISVRCSISRFMLREKSS